MKHLFIDMDGTILPIVGHNGKITIEDWNIEGLFDRSEPIYDNIEAIEQMFAREDYTYHILTAVPSISAIREKEAWLNRYFPIGKRHYVEFQRQTKGSYIYQWCIQNNVNTDDCTLIDDELHNLIDVEKYDVKAIHISYVLSEKGKNAKKKCKKNH